MHWVTKKIFLEAVVKKQLKISAVKPLSVALLWAISTELVFSTFLAPMVWKSGTLQVYTAVSALVRRMFLGAIPEQPAKCGTF